MSKRAMRPTSGILKQLWSLEGLSEALQKLLDDFKKSHNNCCGPVLPSHSWVLPALTESLLATVGWVCKQFKGKVAIGPVQLTVPNGPLKTC